MSGVSVTDGGQEDPLLRVVAAYWDDIQRLADPGQRQRLAELIDGTADPDPDEARAALQDELLDLLPPDHPASRILRTSSMYVTGPEFGAVGDVTPAGLPGTSAESVGTLSVTIYLSEERVHAEVEEAVEALLGAAGLRITDRSDPVINSWFRRMVAGVQHGLWSCSGQDAALGIAHAIDSRLVLAQDAEVTAKLMQNVPAVLGALHPTKDAVLRIGALLIVKNDWTVHVYQLTAAQQTRLDHRPQLASTPSDIVAALGLDEPPPAADV